MPHVQDTVGDLQCRRSLFHFDGSFVVDRKHRRVELHRVQKAKSARLEPVLGITGEHVDVSMLFLRHEAGQGMLGLGRGGKQEP